MTAPRAAVETSAAPPSAADWRARRRARSALRRATFMPSDESSTTSSCTPTSTTEGRLPAERHSCAPVRVAGCTAGSIATAAATVAITAANRWRRWGRSCAAQAQRARPSNAGPQPLPSATASAPPARTTTSRRASARAARRVAGQQRGGRPGPLDVAVATRHCSACAALSSARASSAAPSSSSIWQRLVWAGPNTRALGGMRLYESAAADYSYK